MPTLKRITSPIRGNNGGVIKSTIETSPAEDEEDDRFSQPFNDDVAVDETRTKGSVKRYATNKKDSLDISPFTIASALRKHRNLCIPHVDKNVLPHTPSKCDVKNCSGATDIVAVVLSTPIHQELPPNIIASNSKAFNKSSASSRIHLLIGDHSLPRGKCARVSMSISTSSISTGLASLLGVGGMGAGRLDVSSLATSHVKEKKVQSTIGNLSQLQPGDVVRLNRFEVRNDYDSESMLGKKRSLANVSGDGKSPDNHQNPLLSVTCDLSMSWRDPAAGPSLTRLCRIIPKSSHSFGMQQSVQKNAGYDLVWESIIPPSMETSKEIVTELSSWYCSNATTHFSKSTAILPTNQPCHRRKLREINAPNLLSHVVVKVLRCEKAVSTYCTPRKTAKDLDPVVTHITLSDGAESDDVLGMGGDAHSGRLDGSSVPLPKSISTTLLQAMKEGSHVLLSHVLSRSTNAGSVGNCASLQSRESLILAPTRETTATILTPDHPYYVHEKSTREEENPFASQRLTLERASQLFSLTQQHSQPIIKDDSISTGNCRGVMVVVSQLTDIIIDGIDTSLMEGSHWQAPHKLSKFLIDSPTLSTGLEAIKLSPSYRSATLILDSKSVSSKIVVNADGDAMKLLCMDIPVEDMGVNDANITSNPYLDHVGELLRALCTENIPIRWVLEQESECNWFVTNASLLEI